jgi:hypothetical protein
MAVFSEIKEQITALDPGKKDLRNLGLTFLAVLALVGIFLWWKDAAAWPWVWGLAVLFGLWGLLWPLGLRPVYFAWMSLAVVLGYFVSRIVLVIIYYLVATPTGLVMRLLGRDFLDRKLKDRDSYWQKRPPRGYDPRQTEKMY